MTKINKKNVNEFLTNYKYMNSYKYSNVKYDIIKNKIVIVFNNKESNIKLEFRGIKECNIKEVFDWEEINKIFLDYVRLEEMEFICFATAEMDPNIYIVCDEIKYDIMK